MESYGPLKQEAKDLAQSIQEALDSLETSSSDSPAIQRIEADLEKLKEILNEFPPERRPDWAIQFVKDAGLKVLVEILKDLIYLLPITAKKDTHNDWIPWWSHTRFTRKGRVFVSTIPGA